MARISDLLAAGPTYSVEFFPPKHEAGWLSLGRTISELEHLAPDFVSVTYGAGGSTRTRTADLVSWVRRQTSISPMAHLTCAGHTRDDIRAILTDYRAEGVENILALGGDLPADGETESDYLFSMELVDDVREFGGFSVGVAAHPELHPRSPDRGTDRQHLANKLAAADFAITQFFFDIEHYLVMIDELASLAMEKAGDNLDAAERIGVDLATELCARLIDEGAPGLHFYALNRSWATREIFRNLGLRPAL